MAGSLRSPGKLGAQTWNPKNKLQVQEQYSNLKIHTLAAFPFIFQTKCFAISQQEVSAAPTQN